MGIIRQIKLFINVLAFLMVSAHLFAKEPSSIKISKSEVFIGQSVIITYTVNSSTLNTGVFPEIKQFEPLKVVKTSNPINEEGTITKTYEVVGFDSVAVELPNFNAAALKLKVLPKLNIKFIPEKLLPTEYPPILPKANNANLSFWQQLWKWLKVYGWFVLLSILFFAAAFWWFKKYLKQKPITASKKVININSSVVTALVPVENQQEAQQLYFQLRNFICAALQVRNPKINNSFTLAQLKEAVAAQASGTTDQAGINEVLHISDPTLYAKYYPNINTQKVHINTVATFVKHLVGK
jgi:hypothetical protein